MIRPHQYIWIISLGFLLGTGLGSRFVLPTTYLLVSACLLLCSAVFNSGVSRAVSIFIVFSLVGWWRCETVLQSRPNAQSFDGKTSNIVGTVVSDPEVLGNQQRLQVLITVIDEQPVRLKVLLTSWYLPQYSYADKILGDVQFSLPKDTEEFTYSNYLAKDGIYLTARQAGKLVVTPSEKVTILGALYKVKHWVDSQIHRFLPEPHAGLLAGLLLGIKSDLSDSFKTALKNSGTSHIVALSGFNVTIIITFLLLLLSRLPRRWVWLVSGLFILLFVIMTGAASSVIRAAIMGWLLLLASFWGRKRNPVNAVLLAIVTMVAIHPLILFYDVGFQLSIAATLGLIYCSVLFSWQNKFIPSAVTEAISSTLGATIFSLPLVALYFGGLSLVSLGANILIVPLVPYVMLVGFVGLVAFSVVPTFQWLSIFVWPLSSLLIGVINWFGHLPIAFLNLPPLPTWMPIVYYSSIGIIIIYAQHIRSPKKVV